MGHQYTEEALQVSERRYAILTEMSPVGIFRTNERGDCLYVNPKWCQIAGMTPAEVAGPHWAKALHPEDRERIVAQWYETTSAGKDFLTECRFRTPQGQVTWLVAQATPERDSNGNMVGYIGTITDITQRKQTELALSNLVAPTFNPTEVNFFPALARSLGEILEVEHVIIAKYKDLYFHTLAFWSGGKFVPNVVYSVADADVCQKTIQQGFYICPEKVREYHPSNTYLQGLKAESYCGIALYNRHQKTIGYLCVIDTKPIKNPSHIQSILHLFAARSATELEQLEVLDNLQQLNEELESRVQKRTQELQQQTQLLETILNSMGDGVIVVNNQGEVLLFNPAAQKVLGIAIETMNPELWTGHYGLFLPDGITPYPLEQIPLYKAVKGIVTEQQEMMIRNPYHPQGIYVEINTQTLRDSQGNICGGVATFRDITERKLAEIERQKLVALIENSKDFIGIADLEGRPLYLNPAGLELVGITDITQIDHIREFILSEEQEFFSQEILPSVLQQGYWQGKFRFRHFLSGEAIALDYNIFLVKNNLERNESICLATVSRDIRKSQKVQQELWEQGQFLRSIYEGAFHPIFVVDVLEDGQITISSWNAAAEKIFGVRSSDTIDENLKIIVDNSCKLQNSDEVLAKIWACINEKKNIYYESYYKIQEREYWYLTTLNPLENPDKKIYRIIGTLTDITPIKKAEEDLKKSQVMLQLVIDTFPQRVFWKDRNCKYLGSNKIFAQDAKLVTPEELIGKNDFELTWKASAHLYRADDRYVMENNLSKINFEEPQQREDGSIFWLRTTKIPLKNDQGEVIGIFGSYEDITERKIIEQALQESEERFRQLAAAIDEVFWMTDADNTQVLYVSPSFEKIWGIPCENVYNTCEEWIALIHPDDWDRVYENISLQKQRPCSIEYRIRRPNGEEIWIRDRSFPIANAQGEIYRMVGIAEDITERKYLEQEQQKLLSILDATTDIVGIADIEGNLLWLNRWGKSLHNLPEDCQEINVSIADFHPPWALDIVYSQGIPTALAEGQWLGETAILDKNKEEIPISQLILSIKNSQGQVEYLAFVLRDITPLKEAEAALREVNAALEERVEERTVQLRKAKEAAEAANQAKTLFLANMSHELRTPLNAILGFSQLLSRFESLDAQQREYLHIINRNGEHLLNLINDILEMSKIEAGKIALNPNSFVLSHFLDDLEQLFQWRAQKKGLSLRREMLGKIPSLIYTDESKLRQVLINLLGNAVKFTQQGEVILKVQTASTPFNQITFTVVDSGHGIRSSDMASIFEPFFQASNSQKLQEGTGLGLSISRQFVQLLGGELTVASRLGVGSSFSFTIPLILGKNQDISLSGDSSPSSDHNLLVNDYGEYPHQPSQQPGVSLSSKDLASLPLTWLEQMYQAAVNFDEPYILELLTEIPPQKREMAILLRQKVENFDFAEIRQLVAAAKKQLGLLGDAAF